MHFHANKKVIARIRGGLGNQMFCYAAARSFSLRNDAELVIDDETGFKRDHLFQRKYSLHHFNIHGRKASANEKMAPFERVRRFAAKKVSLLKKNFYDRKYLTEDQLSFNEKLVRLRMNKTVYLDGLWQSPLYFMDFESRIREDFRFTGSLDTSNAQLADQIQRTGPVAVHYRWYDQPDEKRSTMNIGFDYYKNAIREITRKIKDPCFYVFSTDTEAFKKRFDLSDHRVILVRGNTLEEDAYKDMWLMSLCRHFIIANSTFSWWGAWLSNNRNKMVIVPKEIRTNNKDIIPITWTVL